MDKLLMALPDLIAAATFLAGMILFLDTGATFRQNLEGAILVEMIILLLPTLLMLTMRSRFRAYAGRNRAAIQSREVDWEKRFDFGTMIVFPTAMLWILLVIPAMMIRTPADRKPKPDP